MKFLVLMTAFALSVSAYAKVEVSDETGEPQVATAPEKVPTNQTPATGKKAAEKYFTRKPAATSSASEHYLAVHLGSFVASESYRWGGDGSKQENTGKLNAGVSYRVGEWVNSMDMLLRADVISYELPEGRPIKLSLMPVVVFPDSASKFPLYFGGGIGAGIYFKQIGGKSSLSLDYSLLVGARFFDLFEGTGFFVEGGLKNQILILSEGQFIGTYLAAGALFSF